MLRRQWSAGEHSVNADKLTPRRMPVFYEILAYLAEHPLAHDTVEGILEWWLLKHRLTRTKTQVRAALVQLVAEEWVIAHTRADGRLSYRVNRTQLRRIRRLLREKEKAEEG